MGYEEANLLAILMTDRTSPAVLTLSGAVYTIVKAETTYTTVADCLGFFLDSRYAPAT